MVVIIIVLVIILILFLSFYVSIAKDIFSTVLGEPIDGATGVNRSSLQGAQVDNDSHILYEDLDKDIFSTVLGDITIPTTVSPTTTISSTTISTTTTVSSTSAQPENNPQNSYHNEDFDF